MTHSYATFHRCEHPRPSNDVILRLIEHYPDGLKQKDKDGNLAIHSACENNAPNDKVILKMMELYPGSLETKDKDGNLAIHSLSENTKQMENRDKVILTMIDLYPDSLRRKDKDGNTPLHSFIENPSQINNREKVIGVMVKEYEGALAEKDRDKNLPIHSALAQGKKISIEGIKALLVNRETLLVKNARGNIPFHQAFNMAGKKLDDKANAILTANPSVLLMKKSEYFGRSLYFLNFAINKKNKKWIELCLEICRDSANCVGSNNETALHSMLDIQVYTDDDIKALLACTKAETLIKKDNNGYPVFFKAFTKAKDVLNNRSKLILEANPNVLLIPSRSHGNMLLLDWAMNKKDIKLVELFCRLCPKIATVSDRLLNLPIHNACERKSTPLEIIRAIFRAYPRCLSTKDKDGNTPLHSAVETLSGNTVEQVVNMFLDESTKCATIKDKDGNMALHSACECDKPSSKVILRLIQANPKALEKRDKEKNLPLHSALELGDVIEPDVIKVMIDTYPGAVKIKDKEKNTPLHSAVENMRKFAPAVVDMLLKADPGKYAIKQRDTEGNLAIHSA